MTPDLDECDPRIRAYHKTRRLLAFQLRDVRKAKTRARRAIPLGIAVALATYGVQSLLNWFPDFFAGGWEYGTALFAGGFTSLHYGVMWTSIGRSKIEDLRLKLEFRAKELQRIGYPARH